MIDIIMKDYVTQEKICGFKWQQVPRDSDFIKDDTGEYQVVHVEWNQFGKPTLFVEKIK